MQEYKRIDITVDEIVPVARQMRKAGILLLMIHGFINSDGKLEVCYDYAVEPEVESYHVTGEVGSMVLPSLEKSFSTAATWPERELNELYGIEFEGLDTSKRLFLPEDMLETQGKGQIFVMPLTELREKNIKEDN